ncbi:MAG: DeoR/GlpR transcriptional regulator [Clostridia bacterium]|nr:DeoR/GlpR transcriptional regulator [Clostridia bacterium]
MIQFERQEKIIAILERKKSSSVRELARELFVSEASIRRDIESLENKGLVKRVYGGVLLSRYQNSSIPIDLRDGDHSAVKEEIARRAAELVHDGDTLFLDASSTVRRMMKYLGHRKNLKIITHNVKIFSEYGGSNCELFCTGGTYSKVEQTLVGPAAENYLRSVSADLLFFSSQAITEDGEITDSSEEETALRRIMIARSARQYFLCDDSKIGERRIFSVCHKDDITGVICNTALPWEK